MLVSPRALAKTMPTALAVYDTRNRVNPWRPAPHLELLNNYLLDVATGRIRRLIVNEPPRHGKTTLIGNYFPAWYLGNWPDRHVLFASYEAAIAKKRGRETRDILERCGRQVFNVSIREDVSGASEWETTERGGMFTAGVRGPFTGRGGNLLIIDDPVKNQEEARSRTVQDNTLEWFKTTALTRVEDRGGIVLVMTRWSQGDLAGRLMDEEPDEWTVLNLPALAEDDDPLGRRRGEPLWPEKFPVHELEKIRATQGPTWFAAMYQGRPVPEGGAVFKREYFKYAVDEPDAWVLQDTNGTRRVPKADCSVYHTMDTAATEKELSDYTVIATWALTPQRDLILTDLVRVRVEAALHRNLVLGVLARHGGVVYVEQVTFGLVLIQTLRNEGVPIRGLKADRDKVSRSRVAEAAYSVGKVYHVRNAQWLPDAERELLDFPNGAHDDIADAVSYGAIMRQYAPDQHATGLDLNPYY